MTTESQKKIKIEMSERAPLRIVEADWPVVAEARWHNGQYDCQANYIAFVRVREHADGRRIVYGAHDAGPGGVYVGFRPRFGGFLVPAIDLGVPDEQETIRALRRVEGIVGVERLSDECIADLPAQDFA